MAQVLVFASQKGGSGKTTLSGHVAVEAEKAGDGPVALIDCDPQGSLASWWNAREQETPAFAHATPLNLRDDLEHLHDAGFKLIVIDTPPAVTGSISEIVSHADLVVIPTRPSPHDLRAVGTTVDIVDLQKKHLVFVVNAATARARITGETAVALSQHGTVAPVMIHNRVDFAASMIDGRTVGEINPTSRSAKEISALWAYLADRLARMRATQAEMFAAPRRTFEDEILTGLKGPGDAARQTAQDEQEIETFQDAAALAGPPGGAAAPEDGLPSWPVQETQAPKRQMPQQAHEPQGDQAHGHGGQNEEEAWDGRERRRRDVGPPPGVPERRGPPVFGQRSQSSLYNPTGDHGVHRK